MTSTLETEPQKQTATPSAGRSRFVWYELHTPDAAAAARFYQPVLGWTTRDGGIRDRKYTLVCVEDTPIGGLLEKPASAFASGEKPRWIGYIVVPDVHVFSQRVEQAGGLVHRPAEEIPGVGTFAVVGDPQSAIFTLFQPLPGIMRSEPPPLSTPGMPAWHDLGALDWPSEFQFYSNLFGWTKSDAIDMGPNGVYQIFGIGSEPIGGMMNLPGNAQGAGWMFYFRVDEIDASIARVHQHGGRLVDGPSPVPGGLQIAHCLDAQGAVFAMVAPGRQ